MSSDTPKQPLHLDVDVTKLTKKERAEFALMLQQQVYTKHEALFRNVFRNQVILQQTINEVLVRLAHLERAMVRCPPDSACGLCNSASPPTCETKAEAANPAASPP